MPTEPSGEIEAHEDGHAHAHESAANAAQAALTRRVGNLLATLERTGVATVADVDATLERFLAAAQPSNGARVVARTWTDDAFKTLLLADANSAIAQLGIDMTHWAPVRLRAVENTADTHNVVVCTLCSCYPIALLGPSPAWYKSEAYRSRVVREPRAVLREFGFALPDGVAIRVWDSTAELRYIVIPSRPNGTAGWTEQQLAPLVTRDALIGVAPARNPG